MIEFYFIQKYFIFKIKYFSNKNKDKKFKDENTVYFNKRNNIKYFIKESLSFIFSIFSKQKNIFIYKPDLSTIDSLKLQLKLGQVPNIYNEIKYKRKKE